jgi:hypothetical protein
MNLFAINIVGIMAALLALRYIFYLHRSTNKTLRTSEVQIRSYKFVVRRFVKSSYFEVANRMPPQVKIFVTPIQ